MVISSPLRCNMMKQGSLNSAKSERLTITLGGGQRQKIEAIATHRRTSAATVIRWALDEYIEANEAGGQSPPGRSKRK